MNNQDLLWQFSYTTVSQQKYMKYIYFPYTLFLENLVFPSKFYTQTSVEFGTTRSFPAKCWAGAARTADYAPQGYFSGAAKLKKRGFVLCRSAKIRTIKCQQKFRGNLLKPMFTFSLLRNRNAGKWLNQVWYGKNVLKKQRYKAAAYEG